MAAIAVHYDAKGVQAMLTAALRLKSHDLVMRRLNEAVQRAGRYMLPIVRRELRAQTRLKPRVVSGATRGYVPAGYSGVYQISATGKGPYIASVEGTKGSKRDGIRWSPGLHWKVQTRDSRGRFGPSRWQDDWGGVTSMPWNVGHRFKRSYVSPKGAFVAAIPNGTGKHGWSYRTIRGPAPWKELVKDRTLAVFETKAPVLMMNMAGEKLARLLP